MNKLIDINCEGFECGKPLQENEADINYFRSLNLPILCMDCTASHLQENEDIRNGVHIDQY